MDQDTEITQDAVLDQNQDAKTTQTENVQSQQSDGNTKPVPESAQQSGVSKLAQKIAQLQAELNVAKIEIDEWKNKSLRLAADIQNQGRQHDMDIQNARKTGKKFAMQSVSTFLNTLHMSFAYMPKTDDSKVNAFMQTLQMSFDKVIEDLSRSGITILTTKIGEPYNPDIMSSINNAEGPEPVVKQILSLGIEIDGQQVQPITVMLADKTDTSTPSQQYTEEQSTSPDLE